MVKCQQFRDGECDTRANIWDEAVAEALGWDFQGEKAMTGGA